MVDWIDEGVLAGMSASLAFLLFTATMGFGFLVWKYRGRFKSWRALGTRDRADAILNLCLCGVFGHSAYQRALATYAFADHEWPARGTNLELAFWYLPWTVFFMLGVIWWLLLEMHGEREFRAIWVVLAAGSIGLGIAVAWVF